MSESYLSIPRVSPFNLAMARTKQAHYEAAYSSMVARPMNARERKKAEFDERVRARVGAAAYVGFRTWMVRCLEWDEAYVAVEEVHKLIGQDADLWDGFLAIMTKKKIEHWDKAKGVLRAVVGDNQDVVRLMEQIKLRGSAFFNERMEELWGLVGGAWDAVRVFAPFQTKRWDALKQKLDTIVDSAEFRKLIYKLKAGSGVSYEHVDAAYRVFGKDDEAAWARFAEYMPDAVRQWEEMKGMLLPAAERLNGDYPEFLRCLHSFIDGTVNRKKYLRRIYALIGSFRDAWNAFTAYFPDETRRFCEYLSRPAPSVFSEDMLRIVLLNLPFPSTGRLSACCVWLNLRISRRDMRNARERALRVHGAYELIREPRPRFVVRSTNEETINVEPIQRGLNQVRVNGELWRAVSGRLVIGDNFFDVFTRAAANAEIWFRFEGADVRVYIRAAGAVFTALLRRE